jgi:hypothetical protein
VALSLVGGELYIYQVGDWHEVDLEMTSMIEGHVLLLAKAALATGRNLPCRVVEPKCRRERQSGHRPPEPVALAEKTPRIGQLSFSDQSDDWTANWLPGEGRSGPLRGH